LIRGSFFEYDETKDVLGVVPPGKTDSEVEAFTIVFEGSKGNQNMVLAWENTLVKVLKYR